MTEQGQLVGTPEYMSPEQAELSDRHIDTRTDVYALGVLLYELLTGAPPIERARLADASFSEICRIVREDEPRRPSTRLSRFDPATASTAARPDQHERLIQARALRGDLDWITLKAIEKEPERRYQSAAGLAADIRRHLTHEPVIAGPPSTSYRVGKFVRRHRSLVIGTTVVMLVLIAGIIATGWQARRATQEAAISRQINAFITNMLSSVNPARARGDVVTVRDVLDEASRTLESSLADQPRVQAALHNTIGTTYQAIGEYEPAEFHLRRAAAIFEAERGPRHEDTLSTRANLALLLKERGRFHDAEIIARDALAIAREALGSGSRITTQLTTNLGVIVHALGKIDEAETLYRASLEQHLRLSGEDDAGTTIAMTNLGVLLMDNRGDTPEALAEAESLLSRCLEIRRRTLGDDHPDTLVAMTNLAGLYSVRKQWSESEAIMRDVLVRAETVLGPTHPLTMRWSRNLAVIHFMNGDIAAAESRLRMVLEQQIEAYGEAHPNTVETLGTLVSLMIAEGNFEEAEPLAQQCYECTIEVYGADHDEVLHASTLFIELYEAWGRDELAAPWRERVSGTTYER
jgi:tetratricopeptide (TPR) repeat protein